MEVLLGTAVSLIRLNRCRDLIIRIRLLAAFNLVTFSDRKWLGLEHLRKVPESSENFISFSYVDLVRFNDHLIVD